MTIEELEEAYSLKVQLNNALQRKAEYEEMKSAEYCTMMFELGDKRVIKTINRNKDQTTEIINSIIADHDLHIIELQKKLNYYLNPESPIA